MWGKVGVLAELMPPLPEHIDPTIIFSVIYAIRNR